MVTNVSSLPPSLFPCVNRSGQSYEHLHNLSSCLHQKYDAELVLPLYSITLDLLVSMVVLSLVCYFLSPVIMLTVGGVGVSKMTLLILGQITSKWKEPSLQLYVNFSFSPSCVVYPNFIVFPLCI